MLLVAALVVTSLFAGNESLAADDVPVATAYKGVPAVGALFTGAVDSGGHSCSGSVLRSTSHDLVLTAAHCVSGDGSGMLFVPAYDEGHEPYGVWKVTAAYAERAWLTSQDPRADYVILRVAPQSRDTSGTDVEDLTGGYALGSAAPIGAQVRVTGYSSGEDDDPITCDARVGRLSGFPSFNCHNFVDGTSGSPWLKRDDNTTQVVGIIGGWHQGGCTEETSTSSPFGPAIAALLARAEAAGHGDDLPAPGPDGC